MKLPVELPRSPSDAPSIAASTVPRSGWLHSLLSSLLISIRFYIDLLWYSLAVGLIDGWGYLRACFMRDTSLNSLDVAAHTAPTFIKTFFKHMLLRTRRKGKATEQLSYEEGLELVKDFLQYAATHTVEELQSFTSKETPVPSWVERSVVEIPPTCLETAAAILLPQFQVDDPNLQDLGGEKWWTLRARPLFGEWVEMLRDVTKREALRRAGQLKKSEEKVILYLHGGAHYFAGILYPLNTKSLFIN